MDIGTVNEEEVQCPLCLRYHNIRKRGDGGENEGKPKPSLCEVFGGTVKVIGVAGVAAMLLAKTQQMRLSDRLPQTESASCVLLSSALRMNGDRVSANLGKVVMGAMVLTGVIGSVWTWACKQRSRRQREEEFRANLEICKECWTGIRQALLNGDMKTS